MHDGEDLYAYHGAYPYLLSFFCSLSPHLSFSSSQHSPCSPHHYSPSPSFVFFTASLLGSHYTLPTLALVGHSIVPLSLSPFSASSPRSVNRHPACLSVLHLAPNKYRAPQPWRGTTLASNMPVPHTTLITVEHLLTSLSALQPLGTLSA